MRKISLLAAQVLFLFSIMIAGFTSCTTSDSDSDSIEGELNSEIEDMDGEGGDLDSSEVAEDGSSSDDVEDDISDDDFEDSDSSSSVADSDASSDSEEASDDDFEDSEFAAEDADKPKGASGGSDVLAEQDLAKELEKPSSDPVAAINPPATAPLDDPMVITPSNAPPPVDPAAGGAPIADAGGAYPSDAALNAPSSAGVATGTITSKESGGLVVSDPFEEITSAPPMPNEDLGVSDPLVADVNPPSPSVKAAQEQVPVSKVDKDPFFKNQRLMNSVYIARPGDDLMTISQKIYNEDRTGNLKADNPHVANGVEPGDKIYYNSPNRGDDTKAILTYFEDNKMSPMYYITQKGDDIQKIGRQVLGYEDAWKEIWAVNDALQTQALLPSGLKVRYWSGNELKAYDPPAPAAADTTTQMAVVKDTTEVPIDLPPAEPMASLPTEDPGMQISDSSPLPQETSVSTPALDTSAEGESDLTTIAGAAILGLAVLAFIAIQIKNRRKDSPSMPPSLEFNKV